MKRTVLAIIQYIMNFLKRLAKLDFVTVLIGGLIMIEFTDKVEILKGEIKIINLLSIIVRQNDEIIALLKEKRADNAE